MDSVGEGEGGKIWENGIETCIISCMKRVASPGSFTIITQNHNAITSLRLFRGFLFVYFLIKDLEMGFLLLGPWN